MYLIDLGANWHTRWLGPVWEEDKVRPQHPRAQVHTFHQAGHTPFLSQPDEFYPLVRTFLHQP